MKKQNVIRMLTIMVVALFMVAMTGCGASNDNGETGRADGLVQGDFTVAILQIREHPALNAAREGFINGLADEGFVEGSNIQFNLLNPHGDISVANQMAQQIVDQEPDLILSIATPSSQALRAATREMADPPPVVITAVTDPYAAGLIESFDRPMTNFTGTSDLTPVENQFILMRRLLPDVQTVGIMYNAGEINSVIQADMAAAAAREMGLAYIRATVTGTVDFAQVAESPVEQVQVVYTPTCNTMAEAMSLLVMIAAESANIPVIAGERGGVTLGALATEGIDYYYLGRQSAVMAAQILRGEAQPEDMPIQWQAMERTNTVINITTADRLGITIPEDVLADADVIE